MPRFTVYFDPDEHPEDTLKAFEEFIKKFSLRYEAQFPDPQKFLWKPPSSDGRLQAQRLINRLLHQMSNSMTRLPWNEKTKSKIKSRSYLACFLHIDFMKIDVLPSLMEVYA